LGLALPAFGLQLFLRCDPLVVLGALGRVAQHVVRGVQQPHDAIGLFAIGVPVRVVLLAKRFICGPNDFGGRIA
jgi:hypothetical protein